jgi:hypothetical protein
MLRKFSKPGLDLHPNPTAQRVFNRFEGLRFSKPQGKQPHVNQRTRPNYLLFGQIAPLGVLIFVEVMNSMISALVQDVNQGTNVVSSAISTNHIFSDGVA